MLITFADGEMIASCRYRGTNCTQLLDWIELGEEREELRFKQAIQFSVRLLPWTHIFNIKL